MKNLTIVVISLILLIPTSSISAQTQTDIPGWVKNNADWWSQGIISDKEFATSLGFLVKEKIIQVESVQVDSEGSIQISDDVAIPDWIRNNAKWWASGAISDNDFKSGVQFMIQEEIISFDVAENTQTMGFSSTEMPTATPSTSPWKEVIDGTEFASDEFDSIDAPSICSIGDETCDIVEDGKDSIMNEIVSGLKDFCENENPSMCFESISDCPDIAQLNSDWYTFTINKDVSSPTFSKSLISKVYVPGFDVHQIESKVPISFVYPQLVVSYG